MIQSILEQKMALAAYTAENDILQPPPLTTNQLEIVQKMMLVLSPIEEITRAIRSKQLPRYWLHLLLACFIIKVMRKRR